MFRKTVYNCDAKLCLILCTVNNSPANRCYPTSRVELMPRSRTVFCADELSSVSHILYRQEM